MERIDSYSKCTIAGCKNLGEVNKIVCHKVHRRKFCTKHKREFYGMEKQHNKYRENSKERFKTRELDKKCMVCGWVGPCDIHRKEMQGSYDMKNMIATCPNCHRLLHRGLIKLSSKLLTTDFSLMEVNKSGISPFMLT